ncbi:MAG: hypothetical protein HC933_11045 [Pleurocapsa sp. SU_196_0]|nr:hypothetical protein [Pleurocapsa sp. SU_196_0]
MLQRLERFGTRVYRTDRDGAITYDLNTGGVTVTHQSAATGFPGTPGKTRSRGSNP